MSVISADPRDVDRAAAQSPSRELRWFVVHLGSLGFAGAVLLVANRNQWFYFDEWTFIVQRGPNDANIGLFAPHIEHWSTIPALIYKGLLSTVALESYWPYIAVLLVLHLGLAHLLWRASIRAGASTAIATSLAGVFAVLGVGYENLIWAFQMTSVGSVAFGWLAVLMLDHDGRIGKRDVAGWLALIVALQFQSPAIVFIGVAAVTVALRRRRTLDAFLAAAVPGTTYGLWWLAFGRDAVSERGNPWLIIDYAWTGLTHAAEAVVGIPGSGGLLILALLYWWLRHVDIALGRAALAASGCLGALAFFILTGGGRVSLGLEQANAARYVYVATALMLPAAAVALTGVLPPRKSSTVLVVGLGAVIAIHNLGVLRSQTSAEMGIEQSLKGTVAAGVAMLREDRPLAEHSLAPRFAPDLNTAALRRLHGYGWLPSGKTTPRDDLNAQLAFQVGIEPVSQTQTRVSTDVAMGEAGATVSGTSVTLSPTEPGLGPSCTRVRSESTESTLTLTPDLVPMRIRVTGPTSAANDIEEDRAPELSVQLATPEGVLSDPSRVVMKTGTQTDLVSHAADRKVILRWSDLSEFTACGIRTKESKPDTRMAD